MKKYSVRIAGLALLFATGAVFGMEQQTKVYVKNHLTRGSTGEYQIAAQINDQREVKVDQEGETKLLGDLSSINTLKMRRPGFGSGQSYVGVRGFDDLTNNITEAKREVSKNADSALLITVEWKYPGSYTSYEWKYTFSWVNPTTLTERKEGSNAGMSQLLVNYLKDFDVRFANMVGQIWLGDRTPNKIFRNKLEEYTRLYADKEISAESYGSNIEFLLGKLNEFNSKR